jgi:hypothetical protein
MVAQITVTIFISLAANASKRHLLIAKLIRFEQPLLTKKPDFFFSTVHNTAQNTGNNNISTPQLHLQQLKTT